MSDNLKMFHNGNDTIIAPDLQRAIYIWEQVIGDSWADYEDEGELWEIYPDDKVIKMVFIDEREIVAGVDCPTTAVIDTVHHGTPRASATVIDWINFISQESWFSSKEY